MSTRPTAVAGSFYPADAGELRQTVEALLGPAQGGGHAPEALIAPHAGYRFSGPVAASAYRLIRGADRIRRVVLVGPSHHVPFHGIAVSSANAFSTPLGPVPLDRRAIDTALTLPQVIVLDEAHGPEHSLEVHLPFLQVALGPFALVPLVVGRADAPQVAEVLDILWGGEETLTVVSSDLSHYLGYDEAGRIDAATSAQIERLDDGLTGQQACGCVGINGLARLARRRGLVIRELDRRNSGDTAGPRDHVVGYGAYAVVDG